MKSDEKYIESRFGKKMPFTVPEGYFDSLASVAENVVNSTNSAETRTVCLDTKLPKNSVWRLCRKYAAVAACVAVVAGGFAVYRLVPSAGPQTVVARQQFDDHAATVMSQSVNDDEIDYTMLDNDDIYSLVASN